MTEKPFSMEPDEDFSQPERLGAAASDAAHLAAFVRPHAKEPLSTVAEQSGWMPALPLGGQRVEPVLSYGPGSGGAILSSPPDSRVIDIPVEPYASEDNEARPAPFAYSLGEEGPGAGEGQGVSQGTYAADQSGLITDESFPFDFPAEAPVNPDDEGNTHVSHVEPEGAAEYIDEEVYKGSPIKDFLIKYNSFILYGGGGVAALALCYSLFFSGSGHHQQQANVIAANAVRQAQSFQHDTSSQGQPTSQPPFPSSGFAAAPGQQAAQNGSPEVIFNPNGAVQPAPPPAPPSQAIPVQLNQAAAQVKQQGIQAPAAEVAQSTAASAPARVQAAPATAAAPQQPSQPVAYSQQPTVTPAQIQPVAPVTVAQSAASPVPAKAASAAPPDTAQLSAVTSQLQQLSASVSSIGSKVSDSQSNMASTISQMDDKISNLQAIVLQLEMKIAVASSPPSQTAPAAAPAAPPPQSPPAAQPAEPPASGLGASQVASLPVLRGYSLQGYSQGAVVVGTPMGEVTVKLNDTVPGAGTAEGLYRFAPSAGQYGIELVTDQGVIRPTAKSPY